MKPLGDGRHGGGGTYPHSDSALSQALRPQRLNARGLYVAAACFRRGLYVAAYFSRQAPGRRCGILLPSDRITGAQASLSVLQSARTHCLTRILCAAAPHSDSALL